ncbi:unnamed protein product [Brassica oleracea var. botrytis]|uniref:Uncharacterized protein n=2 Tax=Brassica TaxID=3705 RepID=A0A0D2ZZ90_BRAOL|nr:unnamed protein product [Brassica napus]
MHLISSRTSLIPETATKLITLMEFSATTPLVPSPSYNSQVAASLEFSSQTVASSICVISVT